MKIFKKKSDLIHYLSLYDQQKSIGFVPTMGALHSGHLALVEASKIDCDLTVASIYVNPTQFNNANDFKKYPKTLNYDLEKLQKLDCDIVYTPLNNDLYNEKEKAKNFDFGTLSINMEGKFRPGHFNGMATVIEKFFNIINPTKAYFGEKDLQQLQIVKMLVIQMQTQIKIIGIPTIREKNGLAKSSRNKLLSNNGRKKASLIFNCLNYCRVNMHQGILKLKEYIKHRFKEEDINLEYCEIINSKNMLPIKRWREKNGNAVCIAAKIEEVRLIDNIIL